MERSIMQLIHDIKKKCIDNDTAIDNLLHISQAEHAFFESSLQMKKLETTTIAEIMGLSPSRFSRVVDKMVQNNYLKRETNPKDRRAIKLSFTPRGRRIRKKLEDYKNNCDCDLEKKLSHNQVKDIKQSLILLLQIL